MYVLNVLVAFLLLISFILPYLPPSTFPSLSLLSLGVSPLILINLIFVVYWLIRLKRRFLLSFVVLIIAYFHFNPFFEISSEGDTSKYNQTLSVLSYNVRLFNAYEKDTSEEKITQEFLEILKSEQPDIVLIQEFYSDYTIEMEDYPYQFIHFKKPDYKLGHAIFSKYPLINKGGFDFVDSYNNTIYTDAVVRSDTVRVYNLHLQSLGILPNVDFLQKRGTALLKKRFSETFVMQEQQIDRILKHKEASKHPVILGGDFNNTSFSYAYRELKRGMQDAYLKKGNGIGTTYSFVSYPLRIDFILLSQGMDVLKFTTGDSSFSDHKPVSATVGW